MSGDSKSFRSAVLGFDRNDVVDYIETMAKERRDEVEAHRRAADVLRRERDEARERISALEAGFKQADTERENIARQSEELLAKRILCTELSERLGKINAELIAERKETERLSKALKVFEREHESIDRAKTLAADLEIMAYKRAEAIETEAMRNTEKARSMLKKLVNDTNSKYSLSRNDAESIAYKVLQELNRMTEWFNEFPRLFDIIDERLDSMQAQDRPQIKAFVPHRFEDEDTGGQPPETANG